MSIHNVVYHNTTRITLYIKIFPPPQEFMLHTQIKQKQIFDRNKLNVLLMQKQLNSGTMCARYVIARPSYLYYTIKHLEVRFSTVLLIYIS